MIQVPSIQAPDALILRSSSAPEEGHQECEAPVQAFIPPASPTRDTRRMACPGGQVICTRQRITQDGCDMHPLQMFTNQAPNVRVWW